MTKEVLQTTDYLPYYKPYIKLVGNLTVPEALAEGLLYVTDVFENLPESLHDFRYEPSKWTPKEILEHLIDTERVFAYRALTFARSENAVLPGFDQDVFVANGTASNRAMTSLINEYIANRAAAIHFFKSLDEKLLKRKGEASGGPLSVAAAGFIISGHELHHCNILKERYLSCVE